MRICNICSIGCVYLGICAEAGPDAAAVRRLGAVPCLAAAQCGQAGTGCTRGAACLPSTLSLHPAYTTCPAVHPARTQLYAHDSYGRAHTQVESIEDKVQALLREVVEGREVPKPDAEALKKRKLIKPE